MSKCVEADLHPTVPRRSTVLGSILAALVVVVAAEVSAASAAVAPAPEACIDCHLERTVMSHPLGVLPPEAGERLPLAPDGTITCGTCHGAGPHAGEVTELSEPGAACGVCHDRGGHGEEPRLAHLVRLDAFGRLEPVELTRTCAGCHDGTTAPGAHVRYQTAPRRRGETGSLFELERGHPVGIDYRASRSVRPRGYRSPSDLPPQIMLEAGTVGCSSCHDLYSARPARLVVDNRGSVLCLSCHAKTPQSPLLPVEPKLALLTR